MTDALLAGDLPLPPRPDYLRHGTTVTSWLTTTDHKRIAILYAITITIFFFMGGVAITLVRLELFTPNGGLLTSDTYNKLFSFHGIVMVWFFLVPSIPNTLGNFLLPLMIGAPDVAFPRLNLSSWYLTIAARRLHRLCAGRRRRRYRLDLLHALFDHVLQQPRACRRRRRVRRRLRQHRHRRQLHRHHPHAARTGHDLVPAAAVRMGDVRHVDRHGAGNAGAGDFAAACDRGAMAWTADFRSRAAAAIRSCSSICSGSTRIRRSTSWSCRRWAWSPRSFPASRAAGSSATISWSMR